jgi:metal-responsive CopG/Arc/MetJ family transcriptional regulator
MASVKTAISIQKHLFEQVDAIARELQISRSRLFVVAMEEFIRRYENQRLLEDLNAAYDDSPDQEEQILHRRMREQHRRQVEGQW